MPPLTNGKYEIIAQELAGGKNQVEALTAAGYALKTARNAAKPIVSRKEIQDRVVEILKAQCDATLVDVTRMHRRYSDMFEADIADIMFTADCECTADIRAKCRKCAGTGLVSTGYKPLHAWPKIWRQMLEGSDVKELMERSKDGSGASWDKIGEIVKLKFVKVRDLGELLARLKPIDAFVNQRQEIDLNVNLNDQINSRIAAGRQRAAQRNAKRSESTTVVR